METSALKSLTTKGPAFGQSLSCQAFGATSKLRRETCLVRIAAQKGVGIGYVMEAEVREDIATGRLIQLLQDWTPSLPPLALYYPGRKNPPAAFTAFIAAARDFAKFHQRYPKEPALGTFSQ